tara:strand:- start:31 stop:549 length:519 start_codon:yes stop_codon:yes gene_type:complete
MKIKILPMALFLFFLIIFIIFFKSLKISNTYSPQINIDKQIPFFTAKIFDKKNKINSGEIFITDDYYLMNIWASWCLPCKDEHPFLMKLSKENNVKIIGINYKDNFENAKKFLLELGNPYNIILTDGDGTLGIEWGAFGVPETYLIYKKKIIKKVIGPLNKNSILEIKKLVK